MSTVRATVLAASLLCLLSSELISQESPSPAGIVEEIQAIAQRPLWPGFNPAKYPVAFFDGSQTLLFNYPGTPEGFTAGPNGVLRFEGRHPAMTANTSVELDGVPTATVLLDSVKGKPLAQIAGLTVHELFHVYADEDHGSFGANEAHLFTYPFTNVEALKLRRMETEAVRRSLAATNPDESARWTMRALLLRAKRATLIGGRHIGYERAQEMNEGLAQYIEDRAADSDPVERIPKNGWSAEQVRARCYASGQFWAERLDVHFPEWKALFNIGAYADLDVILLIILTQNQVRPIDFTAAEKATFADEAMTGVRSYQSKLISEREKFDSLSGWHIEIIVEEGANLLAPRGFDPLNVLNLGDGLVLHTRMLRLGSSQGMASMLNGRAISYGPNDHPLFNGVRSVTLGGIEAEPAIEQNKGAVKVTSEGIDISFSNATVERSAERQIRILLKPPAN